MRISDWSSDVCSSDLLKLLEPAPGDFMRHEFKGGVPGQVAGGEGFDIPFGGKALLFDERDEIGQQRGRQTAADGAARGYEVSHGQAPSKTRKRVVTGKSVSVRLAVGERRNNKKKKH